MYDLQLLVFTVQLALANMCVKKRQMGYKCVKEAMGGGLLGGHCGGVIVKIAKYHQVQLKSRCSLAPT